MTEQVVKVLNLRLPKQEKKEPAIGSFNPRRLRRWLDDLPPLNVLENARQLFRYLHELNRCEVRDSVRYELLEIVRPHVFYVCEALEKDFLGQNLVLPERPRQSASLAQALQTYLADGYLILVRNVLVANDISVIKKALPTFMHRAIVSMRDTLCRTQLLYFRSPRYLWLTLHHLYVAAESYRLLDRRVVDKLVPQVSSSFVGAYQTVLLLGSMGANKLRQSELKRVLPVVDKFASLAEVSVQVPSEKFFYINLVADRGPMLCRFLDEARGRFRYLNTSVLLQQLKKEVREQRLSSVVAEHLICAWSGERERALERQAKEVSLEICFGLSATHYFLSDGADFQSSRSAKEVANLVGDETNLFLQGKPTVRNTDAWTISFDDNPKLSSIDTSHFAAAVRDYSRQQSAVTNEALYHKYTCKTIDVSAGGYGVSWKEAVPEQLKTGELVGVREHQGNGWAIGVVRWVRQQSKGGAQFGIEYLAAQAWPAAVKSLKTDFYDYVRAIVLPEFITRGISTSLLLPSIGFAQNDLVEVVHQGVTEKLYLHSTLLRTAGFLRYEVSSQQGKEEGAKTKKASSVTGFEALESIF